MNTRNPNSDPEERGQVGIGTLIVFIALVLVAAIAAGVLINTAGFLQNQAESTGQESSDQVTQTLQVQSTLGTVNSGAVDKIQLTVAKSPGSGAINVNASTIQYVSPTGATTLVGAGDAITKGEAQFQAGGTVLSGDESMQVTIPLGSAAASPDPAMETLSPGEEVEMKIVTPSGGQTTVIADVPEPLTADNGDQVRL
jgi:flagellin FlaB